MTYHDHLLTKAEPLEPFEITDLREWLSVLKEDIELFGDTPEDNVKIAMIEARIAREMARAA